ncbi:MAG: hypothetical protein P4L79_09995 [Legionella sp.]|nr:hypothetical protein [Legionella sp.]
MTLLDFIDKHWGVWFAIFLIVITSSVINGFLYLAAIVYAILFGK